MALRCNRQAQLVKTPAAEASRPEFNPQEPCEEEGEVKVEELTAELAL